MKEELRQMRIKTGVFTITMAQLSRCPELSLEADHWRSDGTCLCDGGTDGVLGTIEGLLAGRGELARQLAETLRPPWEMSTPPPEPDRSFWGEWTPTLPRPVEDLDRSCLHPCIHGKITTQGQGYPRCCKCGAKVT